MASEENPVVKGALDLCAAYQVDAWRNNQIHVKGRKFNGRKGLSDVTGLALTGLFIAIECKKPGGVASKEQLEYIDMVNSRHGFGFVSDSIEVIADAFAMLRRQGRI